MKVTPNEYLDARRPEWLDAETIGAVRYDFSRDDGRGSRLVEVSPICADICAALGREKMRAGT